MYVVFESGGLQFNAEIGSVLKVPHLTAKPGESISIDKILLYKDGEDSQIGAPYLPAVKVEAEVLREGQADKVTIYKFKRRTKYRKHRGHRQLYSEIKINKIIPS
jgi:large subunit ribosomal protein L21